MTSPLPAMEEICPAAFSPSLFFLAAVAPCILQCKESICQSMTHHNVPPGMDVLLSISCSLWCSAWCPFCHCYLAAHSIFFVLWSLVVIVGSWEGRGLVDVHVAMLSGCMGSCVKQVLLLARTYIFHTNNLVVNMTREQLKKSKY